MATTIKDLKKRIRMAKKYNMRGLPERYELEIENVRLQKKIERMKRTRLNRNGMVVDSW
jgi:hypothetical protein